VNDGSSLTAPTVIVKVCVASLTFGATFEPVSVIVTDTVAVPFESGAAV
jgi:hypothetical protein